MIDKVLNNRYKIERRIGKGGFGEVYRAHDLQLKRDVAIKILLEDGFQEDFKRRFLQESESMAKLMNPHIVTVFDFGEFDNRPYLVMELVNGISALEMVNKSLPSVADVLRIGSQVCKAMAFAHDNGIIHRDLKLQNVMITVDGDAKVLDFGLAKLVDADFKTDPCHAPRMISGIKLPSKDSSQ